MSKLSVISLVLFIFIGCQFATRETSLQFLDKQGNPHTISLPVEDREKLLSFFVALFAEDSFAYTVLGSKPLSWASFNNTNSDYDRTLKSGWETWEKYCYLFPESHLWLEKSKPEILSILIVNEEQFNRVVKNNKCDFQDVLHREVVDGFQLLEEAKHHSLINDVLKGHQALIGIVLGYGRGNAWEFNENYEKRDILSFRWAWKENEYIRESNDSLSNISCPSFAGDPDSNESKILKADYLSTRQKVLKYYQNKDFLEATLSLLAGYRPDS